MGGGGGAVEVRAHIDMWREVAGLWGWLMHLGG